MTDSPLIFDRQLLRRRIARSTPSVAEHSALFDDSAAQIHERLSEVKRSIASALDLSPFPFLSSSEKNMRVLSTQTLSLDEEYLPFAPKSFDLIVSNMGLHNVNDVPGALAQIQNALKPGGLFIAALIGGESLRELRTCLVEAELSLTQGISPRLSPTIDLLTASALLQRAGFDLPVADKETLALVYPHAFSLMQDLRGMGQTNILRERLRTPTRKAIFFETARLYQERFGDAEGKIPASFDVIYLHGWKKP